MNLQQAAVGRDNNFNLIRLVAAAAVLFSHSYPLQTGSNDTEPMYELLGVTMGELAVDIFFVTSGFLVTASMIKRGSIAEFARARVARIYPAAIVSVMLTVFLLGPLVTTSGLVEYFRSFDTWEYVVRCSTMFLGATYYLPGVFESNPYPKAVNSSLWSMVWELRVYMLLAALWFAAGFFGLRRRQWFERGVVVLAVVGLAPMLVAMAFDFSSGRPIRLLACFFIGGTLQVHAAKVPLRAWMGPAAAAVIVTAGLLGSQAFSAAWILLGPYLVLWCAYVPRGVIRRFNMLGDYSYGIYIFAFPIQQTVMMLRPTSSVMELTLIASIGTAVLAILSWHFVEKPFLHGSASARKARADTSPAAR